MSKVDRIIKTAIRNRRERKPNAYIDMKGAVKFIKTRVPDFTDDNIKEYFIEQLAGALRDYEVMHG